MRSKIVSRLRKIPLMFDSVQWVGDHGCRHSFWMFCHPVRNVLRDAHFIFAKFNGLGVVWQHGFGSYMSPGDMSDLCRLSSARKSAIF